MKNKKILTWLVCLAIKKLKNRNSLFLSLKKINKVACNKTKTIFRINQIPKVLLILKEVHCLILIISNLWSIQFLQLLDHL